MKIRYLLSVLPAAFAFSLCAQEFKPFKYQFAGVKTMRDWGETDGVKIEYAADGFKLSNQHKGESKIYRGIRLPVGRYGIRVKARGTGLQIVITQNWKWPPVKFFAVPASKEFREYDFTFDARRSGGYELNVCAMKECVIQEISIEKRPGKVIPLPPEKKVVKPQKTVPKIVTDVKLEKFRRPELQTKGTFFAFDFTKPGSEKGWGKVGVQLAQTPAGFKVTLTKHGEHKIFRSMYLKAGKYRFTSVASGPGVSVVITQNWKWPCVASKMLGNNGKEWRRSVFPIVIPKDGRYELSLASNGNGMFDSLVIEPWVEEKVETLCRYLGLRPRLHPGRGFSLGGINNLKSAKEEWHANLVRCWMRTGDREVTLKYLVRMKDFLAEARKYHIQVCVVINAPSIPGVKGTSYEYWSHPTLEKRFVDLWKLIATELKDYKDVIYGYDLCNEPLDWDQMPGPPSQWRKIAVACIKAIRAIDKETWIIYETGPGGLHGGFHGLQPLPDDRIVYSVHYYSPHSFTHQGVHNIQGTDLKEVQAKTGVRFTKGKAFLKKDLQVVRDFQLKYNVPIIVGEFSVVRWAPEQDGISYLKNLVEIYEEWGWSWCYHEYGGYYWSLLLGSNYFDREPSKTETGRSKVIRAGLRKNLKK